MRTKKAENATKKILSAIALWNKIWYYYSAVEEILCSCDNLRREKRKMPQTGDVTCAQWQTLFREKDLS